MAIEGTITRKQQGIEVNRKERKHRLELGIIITRHLKRKAHLHHKMLANQFGAVTAFVGGNNVQHLITRHVVWITLAERAKEVNGITCFAPLDTEAVDVLTRDKRAANSKALRAGDSRLLRSTNSSERAFTLQMMNARSPEGTGIRRR
jgi:hypothetical protein